MLRCVGFREVDVVRLGHDVVYLGFRLLDDALVGRLRLKALRDALHVALLGRGAGESLHPHRSQQETGTHQQPAPRPLLHVHRLSVRRSAHLPWKPASLPKAYAGVPLFIENMLPWVNFFKIIRGVSDVNHGEHRRDATGRRAAPHGRRTRGTRRRFHDEETSVLGMGEHLLRGDDALHRLQASLGTRHGPGLNPACAQTRATCKTAGSRLAASSRLRAGRGPDGRASGPGGAARRAQGAGRKRHSAHARRARESHASGPFGPGLRACRSPGTLSRGRRAGVPCAPPSR